MKTQKKFLLLTLSVLLLAALILTGCMTALATATPGTSSFDPGEVPTLPLPGGGTSSDALASQSEMREKFAKYEQAQGNELTLFPNGQAQTLLAARESGQSSRLTYDEVLYLINDSAQMYNKYDRILLPNGRSEGLVDDGVSDGSDAVIYPVRPDPSQTTYEEYAEQMNREQADVCALVRYRLWMLDSGLLRYYEEPSVTSSFCPGKIHISPSPDVDPENCYVGYALLIGEISDNFKYWFAGQEEDYTYSTALRDCLFESRLYSYSYSMDLLVGLPTDCILIDFTDNFIEATDSEKQTALYPPESEFPPEWVPGEETFRTDRITLSLCDEKGRQLRSSMEFTGLDVTELLEKLNIESVIEAHGTPGVVYDADFYDAYYKVDFCNGSVIWIPAGAPDGVAFAGSYWATQPRNLTYQQLVPEAFARRVKDLYAPNMPDEPEKKAEE